MTETPSEDPRPAYLDENPYAGQGPVLLEIGEDTGALIVSAPVDLIGREIEIHPFGATPQHDPDHPHDHRHDHHHDPHRDHHHGHAHAHRHRAPHVAVIPRELPNGSTGQFAVFPDLDPGPYTLWLLPDGPSIGVAVAAGAITEAEWPPA